MAAAIHTYRGTIVSFPTFQNFDRIPLDHATNIIYNALIPACEASGVMLSAYGNHSAPESLRNIEQYNREKATQALFNVERIQLAFASLHLIFQNTTQYKSSSHKLKHIVEKHSSQIEHIYISNGDLIAAMLLKGYDARFGKQTEEITVNCQFKVKV